MKTEVSKRKVLDYFGKNHVICFGNNALAKLEYYLPSFSISTHYTAGAYGWNADIYCIEGGGKFFAICTGYRPFGISNQRILEVANTYKEKYSKASWTDKNNVVSEFIDELWNILQEMDKEKEEKKKV